MNDGKRRWIIVLLFLVLIEALALVVNALALFYAMRNQQRIIRDVFDDLTS